MIMFIIGMTAIVGMLLAAARFYGSNRYMELMSKIIEVVE